MVNGLSLIWFKGTTISEPLAFRVIPLMLVFSVIGVINGARLLVIGIRKTDAALKSQAIGFWLLGLFLLDIGLAGGSIMTRDIVLLMLSGLFALPAIWRQWIAFRRRDGVRAFGEERK
jgi:hypothetical protein